MSLWLCGLLSATLGAAGLAAFLAYRGARRALAAGLVLESALVILLAAARRLGDLDGEAMALVTLCLLPLAALLFARSAQPGADS
ncbi:MAG: hypothetical protein V1772_05290, partial [Chloroflexota bacterium]